MSGIMTEWQADALIPDEIWYAGWRDAPRERPPLRIGAQPVPVPDTADGFIRLMARAMIERSAGDGACTEQDLAATGFTAAEIATYADRARTLARQVTATRDGQAATRQRAQRLKPARITWRVPARSEVL
jgi:hypothetical protein